VPFALWTREAVQPLIAQRAGLGLSVWTPADRNKDAPMPELVPIATYDPQGPDYRRAFQTFLDHTDQKRNARAWLERLIDTLPRRQVLIDAGAGTGQLTSWLLPRFGRTIALEPSPTLREILRQTCPAAEIVPQTIEAATCPAPADLVLCSHVFYYLDPGHWLEALEKLASWLAPGGALVVLLQNPQADGLRLLHHFLGLRFDLAGLARQFQAACGERYQVDFETVSCHVVTPDFDSAYTVAEFFLNGFALPRPPTRRAVEDYVRQHFPDPAGGYRLSCHQDFLQVRRKAN
jgi:hypothetical protein